MDDYNPSRTRIKLEIELAGSRSNRWSWLHLAIGALGVLLALIQLI